MAAEPQQQPTALMLLGPTASGKSALAMALAQRLPLEIVSVDSAQVYRGLDIGTAKPTAAERARVPHHLIDLREPNDPYSTADFVGDAQACIPAIAARGAMAALVGGTMLYAHALLRGGLAPLPAADPFVRSRLEDQARQLGWPALHAQLAVIDPITAARVGANDGQRIQRALEVFELTAQPLSALQAAHTASAVQMDTPASAAARRFVVVALMPADRNALHQRIADRFDAMLHAGFIDEVRQLQARGDLHADLPALRAVGYRQAWHCLTAGASEARLRDQAIAATRQLARRQMTWLRSMKGSIVIDPFSEHALDQVHQAIMAETSTT